MEDRQPWTRSNGVRNSKNCSVLYFRERAEKFARDSWEEVGKCISFEGNFSAGGPYYETLKAPHMHPIGASQSMGSFYSKAMVYLLYCNSICHKKCTWPFPLIPLSHPWHQRGQKQQSEEKESEGDGERTDRTSFPHCRHHWWSWGVGRVVGGDSELNVRLKFSVGLFNKS